MRSQAIINSLGGHDASLSQADLDVQHPHANLSPMRPYIHAIGAAVCIYGRIGKRSGWVASDFAHAPTMCVFPDMCRSIPAL